MAGRGRAPSGQRQRERDNKETRKVTRTKSLHGPLLPKAKDVLPMPVDPETGEVIQIDLEWHPMTRKWWDSMRRSPLTVDIGDEGWTFLLDTALLHHKAWSGEVKLMAEVRLRAAKFGVTPEDRARLGIEVTAPEVKKTARTVKAEEDAGVASLDERRARLTGS